MEDYNKIASHLLKIDIGILILNAGVLDFYDFKDAQESAIQDMLNVNIIHRVYLAKALVNQMHTRVKKSGIIFVNSGTTVFPFPSLATYSATQVFLTYIAQAMNIEMKGKIDVLSFECGMTGGTQMGAFY